jgi:hypothetical protein
MSVRKRCITAGWWELDATHVDVSIDDFPFICLGDYDAVYGCGCVGHDGGYIVLKRWR